MRPVTLCSGGDGLTCRAPTHHGVTDVSPWWCGRASIGALDSKPSGARQQPARVKQGAQQHDQDHHRERRGHHEHEARDTEAHQRRDAPPFEAEQRNHPRRHHLPDRIMFRRRRDARFRSGHLGPVGDAGSAITPSQFRTTQTLEEEERAQSVVRRTLHRRRRELVARYLVGRHNADNGYGGHSSV